MSALKPDAVEQVRCRTLLTPASGFLYAFTHSLNPYMGCAFGDGGCGVYCYVAESPIGLYAEKPWGQWVKAKVNAAHALRRDLDQCADPSSLRVFMSSATDPYQPAEARLRITRSILQVFLERPVALLVVQTRSPIVERDLDLLSQMPFAWLSMTVETDDDSVRKAFTPICPSVDCRFRTMRQARERGVRVQAAVSPTLPHDHARFAGLLADSADRAIVDTFFGDGSSGKRTGRRPLPLRFKDLGFGDWRDVSAAERLHQTLLERMGRGRVGWSREGFNDLASSSRRHTSPRWPPSPIMPVGLAEGPQSRMEARRAIAVPTRRSRPRRSRAYPSRTRRDVPDTARARSRLHHPEPVGRGHGARAGEGGLRSVGHDQRRHGVFSGQARQHGRA